MIKITYDGSRATLSSVPANILSSLKEELSYVDKSKLYAKVINPKVCLYNHADNSFPTGLLPRAVKIFSLHNVAYEVVRDVERIEANETDIPSWAYKHQVDIVKLALKSKRCMIESPTGSGKTHAATFFLSHFPEVKSLFIVPSKSLLYQTKESIESLIGEPVGTVGDGKIKWQRITVGIINSLTKLADRESEELKDVQLLIIDEAHRAASKAYENVSNYCTNTDYRLALSATLKRRNNDMMIVEGMSGPLVLKIKSDDLAKKGIIFKPEYHVVPFYHDREEVYSRCILDEQGSPLRNDFGTAVYATDDQRPFIIDVQRKGIGLNKARNTLIIKILKWFIDSKKRKGSALILVEYIDHAEELKRIASDLYGLNLPFCSGSKTGKQIDEMVSKLSSGEYPALISTSVLNEGKDTKPIELVIIAGGGAGGNKVVQQVGRVVRVSESTGKTRSLVIDFTDEDAPFYLTRQAIKRRAEIQRAHSNCLKFTSLEELRNLL